MTHSYEVVRRVPTAAEHRHLMCSVGWQDHIADAVLEQSLGASILGVVVTHDNDAVGMIRLIGDAVHYLYVQDLVVHPDHSDQGLARQLLSELLDCVRELDLPEPFIGLFSSPDAEQIYRDAGFVTKDMTGMHLA